MNMKWFVEKKRNFLIFNFTAKKITKVWGLGKLIFVKLYQFLFIAQVRLSHNEIEERTYPPLVHAGAIMILKSLA